MGEINMKAGDIFKTNQGCDVEVIELFNSSRVAIRFTDEYAHTTYATSANVRQGKIKNPYHPNVCGVGFFGVGSHLSTAPCGAMSDAYKKWSAMLTRCYDAAHLARKPAYAGCSVTPEWHNFQSFSEWFKSQPVPDGESVDMDKDILAQGNKIYGPEYCELVPKKINNLLIRGGKLSGLMLGVAWHKKAGKYHAKCRDAEGKHTHIGLYTCEIKAFEAYKAFKEAVIKQVAEEYRDRITERLYQCLISYEVQP